MKRKILIICMLVLIAGNVFSQKPDPVHFNYRIHFIKDKTYELHITATLDEGWHIYAQEQPKEAIAQPTQIVFSKNPLLDIVGKAKEIGEKERYEDKAAGVVQYQYSQVAFVQTVNLKVKAKTNIAGTITYQACTNEMCLPPKTVSFNLPVNN